MHDALNLFGPARKSKVKVTVDATSMALLSKVLWIKMSRRAVGNQDATYAASGGGDIIATERVLWNV